MKYGKKCSINIKEIRGTLINVINWLLIPLLLSFIIVRIERIFYVEYKKQGKAIFLVGTEEYTSQNKG